MRAFPFLVAGLAASAAIALITVVIATPAASTSSREAAPILLAPETPNVFCADGVEALAEDACFSPSHETSRGLVVYLHGRYGADGAEAERDRQARVARLGNARGFGVLALRGVRGECTSTELADYFCWPSNARNAADGARFIAHMNPAIAAAQKHVHDTHIFLLGFSNGAYFAALIADRALLPFDAIAIAHGGPVHADDTRENRSTPILLITADDDASDAEMRALDAELTSRAWLHEMVAREGSHALPDWDIERAMTFFARTENETLPLVPPLTSRGARPTRERDQ